MPGQTVREICTFLGVPFEPSMLDAGSYVDGMGAAWEANSS